MPLPRRVLFVTESFGVGGTEKHLRELLPELKKRGFNIAAFCFSEAGSGAAELEADDIPVTIAPHSGFMPLRIAAGAMSLRSLLKDWRPTIVHFFLPRPYLVGGPIAIAAGVPIRLVSRRSLRDYQNKWPGSAVAERLLHPWMDAVLGNARAVTDELRTEGCPERQVRLIYNGVRVPIATRTRSEARAALGLDQNALVAVVVANLFPYKGHLDLIAALAKIANEMPPGWTVLCVGGDRGAGNAITRAILDAGLGDRVHVLGERHDVPLLLEAADIGILPSTRNEGFSNAVLEAMAAGLPLVVTNVGGNAEAVIDGESGLVVPPQEPEALATAILRLVRDRELRHSMGKKARARVTEEFSFAAAVQKYCDLYEHLIARVTLAGKNP